MTSQPAQEPPPSTTTPNDSLTTHLDNRQGKNERYETWRQRRIRERHERLRKTANRDNGCLCDTGPILIATWRHSQLTVALEHRDYCPTPSTPYDPDLYATTGQRAPLGGQP